MPDLSIDPEHITLAINGLKDVMAAVKAIAEDAEPEDARRLVDSLDVFIGELQRVTQAAVDAEKGYRVHRPLA